MAKVIGFATEFYTLWDVRTEHNYVCDSYGTYHVSSTTTFYDYIKNISKDLNKVKNLYPNLPIDEDLRGVTQSWERTKQAELPEGFFWYGKYSGRKIDEILEEDIAYCLWCIRNYPNGSAAKHIENSPIYHNHLDNVKKEQEQLIQSLGGAVEVGEVELTFTSNGFNYDETDGRCYARALRGELEVTVRFPSCKIVGGMYPYIMPMVNGKAMKTKGKTIKVNVVYCLEPQVTAYKTKTVVSQHITIQ